jgi:hypothetical protein
MLSRHFKRHLAGSSPGDIAHELHQQTNSGTKVLDFFLRIFIGTSRRSRSALCLTRGLVPKPIRTRPNPAMVSSAYAFFPFFCTGKKPIGSFQQNSRHEAAYRP